MELADNPGTEIPKTEFIITNKNGVIEVSSPSVNLASEREPLRFAVTLEKAPTPIDIGTVIENITIDNEGPKLQEMMMQVQALRDIPERERPRKILQILRSNVHYAYNDVLEDVAQTDPELARWVAENTGVRSSSAKPLTLSEVVDKGYGVCRHLSVGMLALAKEAGMEGAYLTHQPLISVKRDAEEKYIMKNVTRKDNNQPLFKGDKVGDPVYEGHAWVELRTSQGEWIPVDPSTQLVGDTPEGMQTFKDANYIAAVGASLDIEGFPSPTGHLGNQDLWFTPAEQIHTGILEVNSRPSQKPLRLSLGKKVDEPIDNEQWPKPTEYKGPLNFTISSHSARDGLNVGIVEVKAIK